MEDALRDLRHAFRSLRRSPGLSLAAVLTLALGIGANTAMFGVIDALFFRAPPHVVDPARVVRLTARPGVIRAYPRMLDLRSQVPGFSSVAAYYGPRPMSLGQGSRAEQVRAELVTADFFPLLGVQPAAGRFFTREEDRVGAAVEVAVVSQEFARRTWGTLPSALGATLRLGPRVYTVVGVAPRGFRGVELQRPDVWLPMSAAAPDVLWRGALSCERCSWLQPVARLASGVSPAAAAAQATEVFRRHPVQPRDSATVVALGPLSQPLGVDAVRGARLSTWLGAAAIIVLLIACVNVANLLLARAIRREREMAVRTALGCGRGRLIRQLYMESGLLVALGTAGALVATLWLGPLLRAVILPAATPTAALDPRVFLFAAAVAGITTLLAGLAPALHVTGPDLVSSFRSGAREGTTRPGRLRHALLVGQVALTVVLLAGAGLFARSLDRVEGQNLGFDPARVMVVSVDLTPIRPTRQEINAEYQRMREQVARLPGVANTALSIGTPFRFSFGVGLSTPGMDSLPDMNGPYLAAVSPEYFRTLGTGVIRGRGFALGDTPGATPVAVVSQTLARLLWGDRDPLGRCIRLGSRAAGCTEVVGVVEDGRQDRITEPVAQVFVPLAQAPDSLLPSPVTSLVVRTENRARDLVPLVRGTVQSEAPDLPYAAVEPISQLFATQLRPWQLGASLFGLFGLIGLLLGAVGVYGVLSFLVSQRAHEMGVRMALGARQQQLLGLVVGQGLRLALAGVAIGVLGALGAGRALASLLYGISAYDPANLASVAAILILVATMASLVPAWRATRADPMTALRDE